MPTTRLVLDQTDHAESSTSGTLVSDCELIDVSGVLQMQIPDVLTDLDDVILTSPITDEVLQFNGSNWVNASVSGVGGGGNTLDEAYDEGGAGAGRIITADAGAVQIDGSNQLALDVNQADNFGCLELDKNGTGAGTVLNILNDGTGRALSIIHSNTLGNCSTFSSAANGGTAFEFQKTGNSGGIVISLLNQGTGTAFRIDQNGNGPSIDIDSEATSNPLINLAPLSANTRGDIAFSTVRTADPSTPSEGDLWYQSTLEFLKYRDSANNISLTGIGRKSILVENPTSTEDLTMWFTEEAITVRQVEAVLRGSSTPSVTISVMHNTDRNAAGNNVLTSATAITSVTTGDSPAIAGDVTIPADSFVWLETSAQSGTVDELNVTIKFTED